MVVGEFDLVQLFFRALQIVQDILAGGAVFLAQAMDDIQAGLQLLQLVGGVAQLLPGVSGLLGHILHLVH